MANSETVNFKKAAEGIVDTLEDHSSEMSDRGRIHYVYNEAIDDAANFIRDLRKKNPQYATAALMFESAIREWLILQ